MGLKRGHYGEANRVKTSLINLLLADCVPELIANEVPFLHGKRSADLVAIYEGLSIGFEIKSKLDNLRTMQAQLADYQRVFNKVYLVYSARFAKSPEIEQLPKTIGLIIITNEGMLKIHRKATCKINLDKKALISALWRKDLEALVANSISMEFDDLQKYVIKNKAIKTIQNQLVKSLKDRYGAGYTLMLQEKGEKFIIEDLIYITGIKKHQLVF